MRSWVKSAVAVVVSSGLQTVVFPVAGPLPFARAQLAWIALVPWFALLLALPVRTRRDSVEVVLWSYLCGVLWYFGHCYWIYQTMHQYGGLSVPMASLALLLFCLYLGLYHALFGLLVALVRRRWSGTDSWWPVMLAVVWVAVELARARVTSFPWDLLGYSQIDNAALTAVAPWTGVYAISFVVALVNGAVVTGWANRKNGRRMVGYAGLIAAVIFVFLGLLVRPTFDATDVSAVLVQPDLSVSSDVRRDPQTGVPLETQLMRLTSVALSEAERAGQSPGIVLWPEAPTTYEWNDPLFRQSMAAFSTQHRVPMLVDANMVQPDTRVPRQYRLYNSAAIVTPALGVVRRYDKIHLVPFGEFTPYASLFSFASGLTQEVGTFDRGTDRTPLTDGAHRYGTFICYESIFGDEVRQFVGSGADVLVNLSDDGWYGDTSAPFQHINMARMRAIENRRWILRDTNTGITASIDPHGNVRETVPRHVRVAAVFHFAFAAGMTFYTRYGDLFAYACALAVLVLLLLSFLPRRAAVN